METGGIIKLKEWRKRAGAKTPDGKKRKGHLKRVLEKVRQLKVKNWMLVLVLVPLLFLIATLMRQNHIKMTELRDAVLAADEADDDAAIAEGLVELKEFVFHNTVINIVEENGEQVVSYGTGPFYLEHQYLRAAQEALERAEAELTSDANPNGNVYGEAGAICRALALSNGWTWDDVNFINCMMTEINKYPSAAELQDTIIAALPSTELYRHNYASPLWAPTLLGWLMVAAVIIIVVILVKIVVWIVLRLSLLFV